MSSLTHCHGYLCLYLKQLLATWLITKSWTRSTQVSHELNLCAQYLQLSVAEEKLKQYPLAYAIVKHYQDADTNVQRLLKDNENYSLRNFLHSNKTYNSRKIE